MYRQSSYNYFIPYCEGKVLYYNAHKRTGFLMGRAEHERIQLRFDDPISFELEYPTVFRHFEKLGFFVEEGTDEIAALRFAYNKEVVYNPEVHMVLCITGEMSAMPEFVEAVKKHIDRVAGTLHPPLLCLEWTGEGILNRYEELVEPVTMYAEAACSQSGIRFRGQMAVEMEVDRTIHDKLHHDKGIPTYHHTIRKIKEISSRNPDLALLLVTGYPDGEACDKEAFAGIFSACGNVILKWRLKEYRLAALAKATGFPLCPGCGEVEDDRWYRLKWPRLHQYTIVSDGEVYVGKPEKRHPALWGRLSDDGTVDWDEQKRAQVLGMPWFETETCRSCKHLLLFSPICSQISNGKEGACPLKLGVVTPEKLIVKEFEEAGT